MSQTVNNALKNGRSSDVVEGIGMVFQLADGTIQFCDPVAQKLLGNASQLVGTNLLKEPWQTIHADGSDFAPTDYPMSVALRSGKPCHNVVMGFYKAGGELVWLCLSSTPLFHFDATIPNAVVTTLSEIGHPRSQLPHIEEYTSGLSTRLAFDQTGEQSGQDAPEREIAILENMTDAFVALDRQWRVTYMNQRAVQLLNVTLEEVIGKTHWEVWSWSVGRLPEQQYRRAMAEQVPVHFEVLYEPTETWLEVHAYPSPDGLGIYCRDISDRKQSEKVLQNNEEKLRLFARYAPAGIAMFDFDMRYIRVSQRWIDDYNLSSVEAVLGRSHYDIFPEIPARWKEIHQRCLAGATEKCDEDQFLRADGSEQWIRWEIHPWHDNGGQIGGIIVFSEDITSRKQAEVALRESEIFNRQILESSPDCVKVLDLEGRLLYMNVGGQRLLDICDFETYRNFSWLEFWQGSSRQSAQQALETAIAGSVGKFQGYCPTMNGRPKWWEVVVTPIINANGQIERLLSVSRDITERKQAEQQLQNTLQTLTTLIKSSPLPIVVIEPDCVAQIWNRAAEQLFGWSEAEVLGKPLPIVPPEKLEECRQVREAVVKGEIFSGVETYRCKRDGSSVIVSISAAPLYDDRGNPSTILLIFQDVTQRQQAQSALRESEEWTRLALKAARLGTWRYNPRRDLVELDARMCEIWGEPDEGTIIPLPVVLERIHPDDQARVAAAIKTALDPASSGTYEIEYRVVWNDGTERWVSTNGQAQFEGEGEAKRPTVFIGTALDISDRKLAEAALQVTEQRLVTMVNNTSAAIFIKDLEGRYLLMNHECERLFNVTNAEVCGKTDYDLFSPALADELRANDRQVLEAGYAFTLEESIPFEDGIHTYIAVKFPLVDAMGVPYATAGISTDITKQKRLEQALRDALEQVNQLFAQEQAARAEAEQANRLKDEFLAVLSHELRSPLNPILGWTKLLRSRRLDETRTTEALATIERNAKLQAQLIEDLLDISRIMRGKLTLNPTPVGLSFVILASLETVRLAAEAKKIQIDINLEPNVGQVYGDAARLQQVVWNLLSNAVKFTPTGGQVEVRLTPVGNQAQIQVSDRGKGIHPDFLPYVFEHFRQEDGATTRKFGGLGLGLAIARQIVELHGGRIWAESPGEGQGATFTVELPLLNTSSSLEAESTASVSHSSSLPLTGIRVLVVDDEPDSRDVIEFVVQHAGAEVMAVSSAIEALQTLQSFQPDILLSDIGMAGMDGYGLMREIRQLPANQGGQISAIALTAYAGEYDQQQALNAGFGQHLSKPAEPDALIQLIVKLTSTIRNSQLGIRN